MSSPIKQSYEYKGETYYDADIKDCDECGKDWMFRANTQWSNGHCLLAFIGDAFGNSWVMCNRCFKNEAKHQHLFVTSYIKRKEVEEDEEED
jgi:hypothetical protein